MFAAKLTGNKYCSVKEKRGITITPALVIDDEDIGSGSRLNINNLSKDDYSKLCEVLKVNRMHGELPIILEIKIAQTGDEKGMWQQTYEEDDDEVPDPVPEKEESDDNNE